MISHTGEAPSAPACGHEAEGAQARNSLAAVRGRAFARLQARAVFVSIAASRCWR
jgi:hypothetical protein